MADLSNSSFIPKRGPVKHKPGAAARHIYIFTLVSYILMFAVLLATGTVFIYGKFVDRQYQDEVAALNKEIEGFSKANMQQVIDFDSRLAQAYGRLDKSVSMVSVFKALEEATIDTVQLASLALSRESDEKFILTATVETDTFDSTLFQRGIYEDNGDVVTSVVFSNVSYSSDETESRSETSDSNNVDDDDIQKFVSFTAELEVPLSAVPYEAVTATDQPITITDPVIDTVISSSTETDVDSEDNNEENI